MSHFFDVVLELLRSGNEPFSSSRIYCASLKKAHFLMITEKVVQPGECLLVIVLSVFKAR